MNEIPPIGPGALPPADPEYTQHAQQRSAAQAGISARDGIPLRRQPDSIELSPMAKRLILLDRVKNDPPVRRELVDRVRDEIAADRYDSTEKIARVVDEVYNDYYGKGQIEDPGNSTA